MESNGMTRIPSADWFRTHPMQRHTVIVTRNNQNQPYAVQVWKDNNRIVAQCGDSKAGCIPGRLAWDMPIVFDARVHGLIDQVVDGLIANDQPTTITLHHVEAAKEQEPTPQGVGWDDFDWSI